ncbi:MAG TPA: response regulator [Ktedonobacterales bacterium]|nr:response regulator [Ktedonobacterales bacterium]
MQSAYRTVLLVEDNPDDVLLIQRAFHKARLSYPVHQVGDGEEAINYLDGKGIYANRQQHPLPGLLLLDLKLPRTSGMEVLAWLKAQPGLSQLPVVVFTSSREDTDIQRAYELGANSYLVKPVHFDDLLEMVQTLGIYWLQFNERPDISIAWQDTL